MIAAKMEATSQGIVRTTYHTYYLIISLQSITMFSVAHIYQFDNFKFKKTTI